MWKDCLQATYSVYKGWQKDMYSVRRGGSKEEGTYQGTRECGTRDPNNRILVAPLEALEGILPSTYF